MRPLVALRRCLGRTLRGSAAVARHPRYRTRPGGFAVAWRPDGCARDGPQTEDCSELKRAFCNVFQRATVIFSSALQNRICSALRTQAELNAGQNGGAQRDLIPSESNAFGLSSHSDAEGGSPARETALQNTSSPLPGANSLPTRSVLPCAKIAQSQNHRSKSRT